MSPENENSEQMYEGKNDAFMDVDRMVNEGLGGGQITVNNGWIDESTTDSMDDPDSILNEDDPE